MSKKILVILLLIVYSICGNTQVQFSNNKNKPSRGGNLKKDLKDRQIKNPNFNPNLGTPNQPTLNNPGSNRSTGSGAQQDTKYYMQKNCYNNLISTCKRRCPASSYTCFNNCQTTVYNQCKAANN